MLDPEATKDEVTVLEIETKGYKEQKVTVTNNLFYVDFFFFHYKTLLIEKNICIFLVFNLDSEQNYKGV